MNRWAISCDSLNWVLSNHGADLVSIGGEPHFVSLVGAIVPFGLAAIQHHRSAGGASPTRYPLRVAPLNGGRAAMRTFRVLTVRVRLFRGLHRRFSQRISVGSNRGSATVLLRLALCRDQGICRSCTAVGWPAWRFGTDLCRRHQHFWKLYGRFRNVGSKRQRHSSQNVQAQHPPHKEERDHGHDDITYPLTHCFRFGPVCHDWSVAVDGQYTPRLAAQAKVEPLLISPN